MPTIFSNWSGLVQSNDVDIHHVSAVENIRQVLAEAKSAGRTIRAAGTTHSHSDLLQADGAVILNTDQLVGQITVEHGLSTARIPAGAKLFSIGETLWKAGFSLANQGDIDVQSVGGLIGTGVHGTGRSLRSISDSVAGATFVTGEGDLIDTASDPKLLEAVRLNLGALGVVVDVALKLLPAYHLHEHRWLEPVDSVLDRLSELTGATRHFEFFWRPETDKADAKALHPYTGALDAMKSLEGHRVDRAYRIFPSVRDNKHTEMEYSVPEDEGKTCFRRIRQMMLSEFPEVLWPVEYRTLAGDEGWISPARGRATVTISIHQDIALPYEKFFHKAERIFREHKGRPHWGKVHYLDAKALAEEYGETWQAFWAVQKRVDPQGRFLNGHLKSIAAL